MPPLDDLVDHDEALSLEYVLLAEEFATRAGIDFDWAAELTADTDWRHASKSREARLRLLDGKLEQYYVHDRQQALASMAAGTYDVPAAWSGREEEYLKRGIRNCTEDLRTWAAERAKQTILRRVGYRATVRPRQLSRTRCREHRSARRRASASRAGPDEPAEPEPPVAVAWKAVVR